MLLDHCCSAHHCYLVTAAQSIATRPLLLGHCCSEHCCSANATRPLLLSVSLLLGHCYSGHCYSAHHCYSATAARSIATRSLLLSASLLLGHCCSEHCCSATATRPLLLRALLLDHCCSAHLCYSATAAQSNATRPLLFRALLLSASLLLATAARPLLFRALLLSASLLLGHCCSEHCSWVKRWKKTLYSSYRSHERDSSSYIIYYTTSTEKAAQRYGGDDDVSLATTLNYSWSCQWTSAPLLHDSQWSLRWQRGDIHIAQICPLMPTLKFGCFTTGRRWYCVAVRSPRGFFAEPLKEARRICHLTLSIGQSFAILPRYDFCQVLLVVYHQSIPFM